MTMHQKGLRAGVVGAVIVAGSLAGMAPAWSAEAAPRRPATEADTPSGMPKERAAKAIEQRLQDLARMSGALAKAGGDCGHNATLASQLAAATAGLTALGQQIAAETDEAELKELITAIFEDYRVYLLVAPKTAIVLACDKLVGGEAALAELLAKAQVTIDEAKAAGKDVTAAQAAADAVPVAAAAAIKAATEATASVIDLVPDQGDEAVLEANKAALQAAHRQTKAALTELHEAMKALRQALAALNGGGATARSNRPADRATEPGDQRATEPGNQRNQRNQRSDEPGNQRNQRNQRFQRPGQRPNQGPGQRPNQGPGQRPNQRPGAQPTTRPTTTA
jgi:hypothetical protein